MRNATDILGIVAVKAIGCGSIAKPAPLILRQFSEAFFHLIDLTEITLQAVTPAKLARRHAKAARGERLASLRTAQVNHRSQFLLLRQANLGRAARSQNIDHALVQVCGGHFGRMTRQSASVKTIEPAGMPIEG